jgi:four helix bundle protein
MKYKRFEDLPIWKEAIRLTKEIYDISSEGKWGRDFALRDQIRRAIVSVSSNIAEGYEKNNNNELIRFLRIAKGSLGEVRNQIYIAFTVNYINNNKLSSLSRKMEDLSSDIGGFIVYLQKHKNKQTYNPQSIIRNTQSVIRNPQSVIRNCC